jgi:ArsR family transcriptional regulator
MKGLSRWSASTYLRYTANTKTLEELLNFLYSECCTRNQAIEPGRIVQIKGTVKCK